MTVKNAAGDVLAAVNVLQHAREACVDLKPLGSTMTPTELEQRARIIDTVVRTRRLLQLLQQQCTDVPEAARQGSLRA